jgi:hypothetical protein
MWQVSLHQKHTKILTQVDFEPTRHDGCDPVELHVPTLTEQLLWCDIDRSEPTRQHEVKLAQRGDGHAKLASGKDHVATV